jgi:PAS domain S-box-containing protein
MAQPLPEEDRSRVEQVFLQQLRQAAERTDRNFACLMAVQYLVGILAAVTISPRTWVGPIASTHIHVWAAVFLGGLITSLPVFLGLSYPGLKLTRHVIAIGQMLMGALLIHLTCGRIETHFHVFGSLAFLAFYRDWKVLMTATAVVALDHFMRGMLWPRSVFGEEFVEPFRWLEHVGWVLFENLFLLVSIRQGVSRSWILAQRQSALEQAKSVVESERDRFFDLSLDMFCVASKEGYFVRLNPMFSIKLGYSNDELRSRSFLDFVHPDDRATTIEVMGQLQQGSDVAEFENRYLCRDGSYLWLSWNARAPAGLEWIYAVARDVTMRKEQALTLLQARQQAEEARQAAEQASRAKSEFLANMSHEIRTPMNAVIGLTELVLETELSATQRDYLTTVLESGESLLTIINEILDFSKIEAGKIELDSAPFNLREELGDIMKSLAFRAHRKDLELAWHAAANVPDCLIGDSTRLRQVLVNLVGNAIKFTLHGEVVLNVRCLGGEAGCRELRFEIRDTGIGIPADKLEAIFREFEQVDSSTTRRFGGTGLGLSISSRLVELMGGGIEVRSEVGKGSTFACTLPFQLATSSPAPRPPLQTGKLDGLSVLIVDDNATNRFILEETVMGWGMRPQTAACGPQALEMLRQHKPPDREPLVVLTDIQMPDMDGYMLACEIRRIRSGDDCVIIALTSSGQIGDPSRRSALGIAAELLKPVKQSELLEAILQAVTPLATKVESVKARATETPPALPMTTRPLRVLLVEDGLANQKLAVGMLQRWGHHVSIANNGQVAVDLWQEQAFDLILMDLQMPVLDGISATRIIRQREQQRGGHIPIIAMTAHAIKGDRERCLAAGMDGYLSKPVRRQELAQAIEPLLADDQRANGAGPPP